MDAIFLRRQIGKRNPFSNATLLHTCCIKHLLVVSIRYKLFMYCYLISLSFYRCTALYIVSLCSVHGLRSDMPLINEYWLIDWLPVSTFWFRSRPASNQLLLVTPPHPPKNFIKFPWLTFELSCIQTDRLTDWQTDRQTRGNITSLVKVINRGRSKRFSLMCNIPSFLISPHRLLECLLLGLSNITLYPCCQSCMVRAKLTHKISIIGSFFALARLQHLLAPYFLISCCICILSTALLVLIIVCFFSNYYIDSFKLRYFTFFMLWKVFT